MAFAAQRRGGDELVGQDVLDQQDPRPRQPPRRSCASGRGGAGRRPLGNGLTGRVSQNSLPASRSPTVHTEQPMSPPIRRRGAGRSSARDRCRQAPRRRRPPVARTVRTAAHGSLGRDDRPAVPHREAQPWFAACGRRLRPSPAPRPARRTSPRWTAG